MTDVQLESLIGSVVRRVLSEGAGGSITANGAAIGGAASSAPTCGRVLVGICCDGCLSDAARGALDNLSAQFVVSRPAEEEFKKRAWREAQVAAHDVALLPAVCYDMAAKMAIGIFDEPVALLALSALAQGKPVLAVVNTHYDDGLKAHSPVLRRLFEGHRRQLGSYGIEVVSPEEIVPAVQRICGVTENGAFAKAVLPAGAAKGRRQLVTAGDIDRASANGKKVSLPAGALVTPLARDRARELGIVIE